MSTARYIMLDYRESTDYQVDDGRWYLSAFAQAPEADEVFLPEFFRHCRPYDRRYTSLTLNTSDPGKPMHFNILAGVPIATSTVAAAVCALAPAAVERVPITIKDRKVKKQDYEVLNVLDCVDCLDLRESGVVPWAPDTSEEARGGLIADRIDPIVLRGEAVEGHHLFRIQGWPMPLVCSDLTKDALLGLGIDSVLFVPLRIS